MDFVMTSTTTESVAGTVETAAVQTESQTSLNTANNANAVILTSKVALAHAATQNTKEMVTVMTRTTTADVNTTAATAVAKHQMQSSTTTAKSANVSIQITTQMLAVECAAHHHTKVTDIVMTTITTVDASGTGAIAAATLSKHNNTSTAQSASASILVLSLLQGAPARVDA